MEILTAKITGEKPAKGYGTVQTEVLISRSISNNAKLLYTYYCAIQGGKDSSWKSNTTIQAELGMAHVRFTKAKRELVNLGLIISTQRFNNSPVVSVRYLEVKYQNDTSNRYQNDTSNRNKENINKVSTSIRKSENEISRTSFPTKLNNDEKVLYEKIINANYAIGNMEAEDWKPNYDDKVMLQELIIENELHDVDDKILQVTSYGVNSIGVSLIYKKVFNKSFKRR